MTNIPQAVQFLMRVHYGFFMSNKQFWYDRDLQAADVLICVAASDLRRGIISAT